MESGNQNKNWVRLECAKLKMTEQSCSWPTACEISTPLRNTLYAIRHGEVCPLDMIDKLGWIVCDMCQILIATQILADIPFFVEWGQCGRIDCLGPQGGDQLLRTYTARTAAGQRGGPLLLNTHADVHTWRSTEALLLHFSFTSLLLGVINLVE